jgi:Tfp pilus assembly protein PilN
MVSFSRSRDGADHESVEAGAVAVAAPAPVTQSAAAFPRVDLLPDTIAEEARVRRAKLVAGGVALASVAAVGALYLLAAGEVSSAQEELDTAQARSAVLAAEAAQYADVPKVRADVESARLQQFQAMGGEVRFSFLMNDLALTIPRGTSLTTLKAQITGLPAAATATAAGGADGAVQPSVMGNPGIGSISYEGEAKSYNDVAAFLDSLAKQKTLVDPYFSVATVKEEEQQGVADGAVNVTPQGYTYAATVTLSDVALSHRYDLKAGS